MVVNSLSRQVRILPKRALSNLAQLLSINEAFSFHALESKKLLNDPAVPLTPANTEAMALNLFFTSKLLISKALEVDAALAAATTVSLLVLSFFATVSAFLSAVFLDASF